MQLTLFLLLDLFTMKRFGARITWITPLAWIVREALAPVQWAVTAMGDHVDWRGRRMRVERGGLLEVDPVL